MVGRAHPTLARGSRAALTDSAGGGLQGATGEDAREMGAVVTRGVQVAERVLAVGSVLGGRGERLLVGRLALEGLLDRRGAVGDLSDASYRDPSVGNRV